MIILALVGIAGSVAAQESVAVPAPYEPEAVPVHPTLLAKYEEFFPPAVLKVTDGVWVARGYNRQSRTYRGCRRLDCCRSRESIPGTEGQGCIQCQPEQYLRQKPVKAIIYTHHHDCHVNGASVFADEQTEIIGHEAC